MAISIQLYDPEMKEQITALFCAQYGVSAQYFSQLLDNFYDHPYQKNKSVRIVALDGTRVVGFQSFFYWPYYLNGRRFNVYQSGNSLVDPAYRGQQVFARMLQYLDEHQQELKVDLLIGFPINVSRNSLIRNGWKNILDLQWYVATGSIWSFFNSETRRLDSAFSKNAKIGPQDLTDGHIRLSRDQDFIEWRRDYSFGQQYRYFTHDTSSGTTTFTLKPSRRKHFIRELVIGDITSTTYDSAHLGLAFRKLIEEVRNKRTSTIVSFALNPHNLRITPEVLRGAGFHPIKRTIFFCTKNFSAPPEFLDPKMWMLYRSDIDTW